MTYIILAAGAGKNLMPLTLKYPKTSFKLDENTTILQKLVRSIRRYDKNSEVVVVVGYLADTIREELVNDNVKFVMNPFYEVTNSITSLWFARDYLDRENVTVLHGDVVFDDYIVQNHVVKPTDHAYVLVDSGISNSGEYNVKIKDSEVTVMSNKLEEFDAKYACMSKFDAVSSRLVKAEMDEMINTNMYDQFFEDTLVQLVMFHDFQLYAEDIKGHSWSEVDDVDDLLMAKQIHGEKLG